MTSPELFALGIVGVFAIAAAVALIRHRKATFARVRAAYLRSRVTTGGPGLFLERGDLAGTFQPPYPDGTPYGMHSCSFGESCAVTQREADRAATEARVKNGGQA